MRASFLPEMRVKQPFQARATKKRSKYNERQNLAKLKNM